MNLNTESAAVQDLDQLLGQVATEFFERLARGESPTIDEYVQRYPEIASLIRQALPALQMVSDSMADASGGALPLGEKHEKRLGDFHILYELGRGGMGIVYEAEQISMGGRKVALKVLPFAAMVDEKRLQRFRNEVRAAASLDHPNIVSVYSVGEERGVHFYAMQLIRGQSLAAVIDQLRELRQQQHPLGASSLSDVVSAPANSKSSSVVDEPTQEFQSSAQQEPAPQREPGRSAALAVSRSPVSDTVPTAQGLISTKGNSRKSEYFRSVAELGIQAAEALEHAHQQGVVHRDIKPANLMIDARAKLYITDFGLAQMEENAGITMTGDLIGTLRYMSPEQALGKRVVIDHRADIYALGVSLYELLTTEPAYDGENRAALLRQIAFQELRPLRQIDHTIPHDLETIIHKAVAKNPDERYADARQLADDLQRFLDDQPIHAKPPSLQQRAAKWSRRHKSLVVSAAAMLVMATVGLAISSLLLAQQRNVATVNFVRAQTEANRADREAEVAVTRFESEREARLAETNARAEAEQATSLAERNAAEAYRQQYTAEMQLGMVDLKAGNLSRMYSTLVKHLPEPQRADRRGWEWFYLLSRCQEGRTLCEHYAYVSSLAWSPDGRHLATTSYDGDAIVWDARSGQRIRRFSFGNTLKLGVAWSPDSQRLAWGSVGDENAVRIWDHRTDDIRVLRGHTHSLVSCTWSPDGSRLATTSMDKTARIWNTATWECLHVLEGHSSHVNASCWIDDGRTLVTAGYGGVKVWDGQTGKLVRELLTEAAFSSASISRTTPQQLVLGTSVGQCQLIDTASWQVKDEISAHSGNVRAVSFSPDGATFASGGVDGAVIIWDTAEGQQLFVLRGHQGQVTSLAWNPNGNQLAAGCSDGSVKLWDVPPPHHPMTIQAFSEPIRSFTWSKDDRLLTSLGDTTRTIWERTASKAIHTSTATENTREKLSSDGRLKASVERTEDVFKIHVEDVERHQTACELRVNANGIELNKWPVMVWAPDSSRLVAGLRKHIDVWEIPGGQRLFSWDAPAINAASWASDNTRLAIAGGGDSTDNGFQQYAGFVHIFDVVRKTRSWKVQIGSTRDVASCVAWHPNGKSYAAGNAIGVVAVWDAETGRQLAIAQQHVVSVKALDWTPDGSRIASVGEDGNIKVWDPWTGDELLSLQDGKGLLTAVKWSSDGTRLALGDFQGKIQVWDASAGFDLISSPDHHRSLARIHQQRARQCLDKEDLPGALVELSRAIELVPSRPSYRISRARVHARQGRLDEALADLTAAHDLDPDDIRVLRSRLDLYTELGRWTEALAVVSRLAELKQDPIAQYHKAIVLLMLGQDDAYREICRRAFVGDRDELIYLAQERAWTCAVVPGAIADFDRSLPLMRELVVEVMAGQNDPMPGSLGALLYRAGQVVEAVEPLTAASRAWEQSGSILSPSSYYDLLPAYTWYFLAMACHDLGRFAESRTWYDKAEAYTAKAIAPPAASEQLDSSNWVRRHSVNWHQRVVLEMLQREARTKLVIAEPK